MSKKMWKKLSALLLMVVMVLIMSLSVQAAAVKMNKQPCIQAKKLHSRLQEPAKKQNGPAQMQK